MTSYQELIAGMQVEVTGGLYKGRTGVITGEISIDPVRNTPEVMVHLGEKNRESNQPIVYPFGYGVNKVEYLKVIGR